MKMQKSPQGLNSKRGKTFVVNVKMSGKAGNHFYCVFCDVKFKSEVDFNTHCNGKKHKNNERIKTEQDAAEASVLVRGAKVGTNLEQFLASYFCQFGLLAKVSALGPTSHGIARVQFAQPEFAANVLRAGSVHRHCGLSLRVSKFEYKPHGGDAMRLAAREETEKQKGAREELHNNIMQILGRDNSVESQLLTLTENLQLTGLDLLDRQEIVRKLKEVFTPKHPDVTVYQFGSSINRFGTRGCDLDLFLNIDLEKPVSNKQFDGQKITLMTDLPIAITQMKNLHKILSARHLSTFFTEILLVPSHRCPIIKFTHKQTGIKCDLSLNNKKALFNTRLLRLYANDERVRHVVYALRLWAKFRGLSGGAGASAPTLLSSYALTLLALFYLMRCQPEPVLPAVCDLEKCVPGIAMETVEESECLIIPEDAQLPRSKNTQTSVELLQGFFKFYSEEINWSHDALLMKEANITPRATLTQNFNYLKCRIGAITVIDPFNLSHNVAGNVNENFREHLTAEIKRAVELTSRWSGSDTSESPPGLQDLFKLLELDEQKQPNQNEKGEKKNGTENDSGKGKKSKSKKNKNPVRMEGEQETGDFHIILPLSRATRESKLLGEEAKSAGLPPEQCWLHKAKDLTLNVLENIFLVELERKEQVKIGNEGKTETDENKSEENSNDSGLEMKTAMDGSENSVSPADETSSKAQVGEGSVVKCHKPGEDTEMEVEKGVPEVPGHRKKRPSEKVSVGEREMDESASLAQGKNTEICHSVEDEMPKKRMCVDGAAEPSSTLRNTITVEPIATTAATTVSTAFSCVSTSTITTITVSTSVSSGRPSTVLCTSSTSSMDFNTSMGCQETETSQRINTGGSVKVSPERSSFWCKCQHPVWHGRKKLKQEVMQHADPIIPSPLDLEVEITKRYLKQFAASETSGISAVKNPSMKTTTSRLSEDNKLAAKGTDVSSTKGLPLLLNYRKVSDLPQAPESSSIANKTQSAKGGLENLNVANIIASQSAGVSSKVTPESFDGKKSTPFASQTLSSKDTGTTNRSANLENKESPTCGPVASNLVKARMSSGKSTPEAVSRGNLNCSALKGDAKQNKLTETGAKTKVNVNSANTTSSASKPTASVPNPKYSAVNPASQSSCRQRASPAQGEGQKKTNPNEEDPFCLMFSCEILLNIGGTKVAQNDSNPPSPTHLLLKLRPAKDSKNFKVFYDVFRSIMLRLNSSELNTPL